MQNQNNPQNPENTNTNTQIPGTGYTDFYGNNGQTGAPVADPNAGYDPNAYYNQSQPPVPTPDPNAFPPAGFDPNANMNYNNMYDMNQAGQNIPQPDPNQPPMMANDTFEEPKSGNRFLVIGVGVLILVLIGVAGYIAWSARETLFGQGGNSSSSVSSSSSASSSSSSSVNTAPTRLNNTDSNATPAQKAKQFNETSVTAEWLKQYFASQPNAVDSTTGRCLQENICGNDIDFDKDGLSNLQEYNYQTDPLNPDTDGDKVADGDEINVYSTNPRSGGQDSDGDTFTDSQEVINCFDPIINGKTLPASNTNRDKLTASRQGEYKSKIVVSSLHEPTITTLKTIQDPTALINGYAKCVAVAGTSTPATSTSSSKSTI